VSTRAKLSAPLSGTFIKKIIGTKIKPDIAAELGWQYKMHNYWGSCGTEGDLERLRFCFTFEYT